jgi:hypothetical protein
MPKYLRLRQCLHRRSARRYGAPWAGDIGRLSAADSGSSVSCHPIGSATYARRSITTRRLRSSRRAASVVDHARSQLARWARRSQPRVFENADRREVLWIGRGVHAAKIEALDSEPQEEPRSLGGVTMAPLVGAEVPTELGLVADPAESRKPARSLDHDGVDRPGRSPYSRWNSSTVRFRRSPDNRRTASSPSI